MTSETLDRLQELKSIASSIRDAELRLERARVELSHADLHLARVQSAKRALVDALQRAIDQTVSDIANKQKPGESAQIVAWFTSHE